MGATGSWGDEQIDPAALAAAMGLAVPDAKTMRAKVLQSSLRSRANTTPIRARPEAPPAMETAMQPALPQGPDFQGERARIEAKLLELSQPKDLSALQAEGKRRGEQGTSGLLMALAAQQAGPQFDRVQQHMLQRAMEARNPMKFSGGIVNEQGDVVEDPGYKEQEQRSMYERRLAGVDRGESAAALAAAKRAQDAANARMLEDGRNERNAADNRNSLLLKSMIAAGKGDGVKPEAMWRAEDRLRSDMEKLVKPHTTVLDSSQNVSGLINNALAQKRPLTNVEQQAVITMFNHITDPESVVREGEYNRMAQGMGLYQNVQNLVPKIMAGSVITPQMAKQIGDAATLLATASKEKIQARVSNVERIAKQRGLDPSNIVTDSRFITGAAPAAPAAAPAGKRLKFNPATGELE